MTETTSSRRIPWRIIVTIALIVVAAIPVVIYVINQQSQNAPLTIGSGDDTAATPEPTIEAVDDTIPVGTAPRDVLLITDREGDWDIALLDTQGDLLNLTADDTGAEDLIPGWSFDGDTINFVANRRDVTDVGPVQTKISTGELVELTVVGGVITMFREQQFDWDAMWSPNGNEITWVSVRDLNLELYRLNTEDGIDIDNATRLTNTSAREWYPAYSPDGTKLLYNSDVNGNEDLFVMDLATGESTQLTDSEEDDIRGIWSADGSLIAFATERRATFVEGGLDLFVMNADGSDQRPLPDDMIFEGGYAWSPNGTHITYMSNAEGSWQVYVMQVDGSNLRRVTDGEANYLLPIWRP